MKRSWLSLAVLSLSILCAQPLKADFLNLDDKFGELGMMLDNLGQVLQDATATIAANSTDSDRLATRIFAAPEEYPPTEYAAYGIIAFRSLPSPADKVRYHQICLAYYNTLPASPPQFPEKQQMVTVWPVTSAKASKKLNEPQPADKACETALSTISRLDIRLSGLPRYKVKTLMVLDPIFSLGPLARNMAPIRLSYSLLTSQMLTRTNWPSGSWWLG